MKFNAQKNIITKTYRYQIWANIYSIFISFKKEKNKQHLTMKNIAQG